MANLLTNTEDFTHGDWINTSLTVTANTFAAPAFAGGSAGLADTLDDQATGAQAGIRQQKSKGGSNDTANWIGSVFIRKDSSQTRWGELQIHHRTGGTLFVRGIRFDTGSGAIADSPSQGGPGVGNAGVVDVDATWWRFWLKVPDNASGNTEIWLNIQPALATDSITGANSSLAVGSIVAWGAQIEKVDTLQVYTPHPFYEFPGDPPSAIVDLVATPISSSQIDLAWTPATGATSHRIERAPITGG